MGPIQRRRTASNLETINPPHGILEGMRARHLIKGRNAESHARKYLQRRGLKFVESNYRCKPGEIDLIMRDRSTIVFVEVRYRSNHNYGGALESIDLRKQRKLRAAAEHYLQHKRIGADSACRFDVVLITGNAPGSIDKVDPKAHIDWIPNAI